MSLLVFQAQSFSVPMVLLFTNCQVFYENRIVLADPNYNVQSRVSVQSFRTFVGAIGGTEPDIADNNARDRGLLSDEFKFTALSTALADWRAANPTQEAHTVLIMASLKEQLESHDRVPCLIDRKVDRLHQAAIEGERADVMKMAKDVEMAAEQRQALARGMCALDGEIGGLRKAIAERVRRQMHELDEWTAAIGDAPKKAEHEQGKVSGPKEAMGNLEREPEKLREAIATSGGSLNEDMVRIDQQANDGLGQSQGAKAQAMAEVRNMVGRFEEQLAAIVEKRGRHALAGAEIWQGNEPPTALSREWPIGDRTLKSTPQLVGVVSRR